MFHVHRSLAEWGSVGLLERELRQNGRLLRSIVKAQGLWHPNVNSNTSAVFSVDRSRHRLSLASMFGSYRFDCRLPLSIYIEIHDNVAV